MAKWRGVDWFRSVALISPPARVKLRMMNSSPVFTARCSGVLSSPSFFYIIIMANFVFLEQGKILEENVSNIWISQLSQLSTLCSIRSKLTRVRELTSTRTWTRKRTASMSLALIAVCKKFRPDLSNCSAVVGSFSSTCSAAFVFLTLKIYFLLQLLK